MGVEQFLEGIARKDDKAWEELYRYFYAPLCNYAAKIANDSFAAEDVVQDCLVKLWRSSSRFTDMRAVTTYLYRSVYHASLNFVRDKAAKQQVHEDWAAMQVTEEDAVRMAVEEEAISRFYEVVSRLPEQQRDIVLQTLKGAKVKEIAEVLSISENTVKTQKKRAYLFLREQLGGTLIFVVALLGRQVIW